jgi:hypothetical protein
MASSEVVRALRTVRDSANEHGADLGFWEALDTIEEAALAPRTVDEAEARMVDAEGELDTVHDYLRSWTKWADELVPHPRKLTSWDSTRVRERIAAVVVAARDWSPYAEPAVAGLPGAAILTLVRAVDALREDRP